MVFSMDEFLTAVANMRKAQKRYLKSRNKKDLIAMRKLELIVDKKLKDGFGYVQTVIEFVECNSN